MLLFVGTWLVSRFGDAPDSGLGGVLRVGQHGRRPGRGRHRERRDGPLWVRLVINLIGAATVIGATILLFRSPTYTRTLDAADEARVRTLLREFGVEDSLGYFATRGTRRWCGRRGTRRPRGPGCRTGWSGR